MCRGNQVKTNLNTRTRAIITIAFRIVVESIARGYLALYEKKIVHRDLKPQNILLCYERGSDDVSPRIQIAKITDFGISRVLTDDGGQLCNVAGTLLYMAPEVGANLVTLSEYDSCADMWSVGCVFYQCISGKVNNLNNYLKTKKSINIGSFRRTSTLSLILILCWRKLRRVRASGNT